MTAVRIQVLPGVWLTANQTSKFKTGYYSLHLLAPMNRETASANALIPMVLRRGTEEYPDMGRLSAVLDELYGGVIESDVRKLGEVQCIGFAASFLDGAYVPEEGDMLARAAQLLGNLLLHPALEDGVFSKEYVEGERANLADQLRAEINHKRQYAQNRLISLMCANEPYGVNRLGDLEVLAEITPASLYARYQDLLRTAPMELYYCGSASPERAAEAWRLALTGLERDAVLEKPKTNSDFRGADKAKSFSDHMDVTQGKLVLGFRTGIVSADRDYPALMVLNALYGATTTSKLFMNVRERLSLCYYASSALEKHKGLMLVSSGVEFAQFERAREEILAQLSACQRGDFTEEELESARRAIVSNLRAAVDSQGGLEDFWLNQSVAGLTGSPEELAEQVGQVSREQVSAAGKRLVLDSVYYLKGQEV